MRLFFILCFLLITSFALSEVAIVSPNAAADSTAIDIYAPTTILGHDDLGQYTAWYRVQIAPGTSVVSNSTAWKNVEMGGYVEFKVASVASGTILTLTDYYYNDYTTTPSSVNARYKFNSSSGVTAIDSSQKGYDGTFNTAPTWGASPNAKISNAVTLSGSQYATIPTTVTAGQAGSVSVWVKFTNTSGSQSILSANNSSTGQMFIGLYYGPGLYMPAISFGNGTYVYASDFFMAGTWYHCVFVSTGLNAGYSIYTNGVNKSLVGGANNNGNWWSDYTNTQAFIGVRNKGSDNTKDFYFNGSIDDLRVYNYALNANEVAAIYNAGTGTESELPSFWDYYHITFKSMSTSNPKYISNGEGDRVEGSRNGSIVWTGNLDVKQNSTTAVNITNLNGSAPAANDSIKIYKSVLWGNQIGVASGTTEISKSEKLLSNIALKPKYFVYGPGNYLIRFIVYTTCAYGFGDVTSGVSVTQSGAAGFTDKQVLLVNYKGKNLQ